MYVPQPRFRCKQFQKIVCSSFLIIFVIVLFPVVSADIPSLPGHTIVGKITYSDDIPAVNANITITNVETHIITSTYSLDTGNWIATLSTSDYPNGTKISIIADDGKGNRVNMTAIIDTSGEPQWVNAMKFKVPAPSPPPAQTPTDSGDGGDGYVPATPTPPATPVVTPISTPTVALTQTPKPTPAPTITATDTPAEPTPASTTPTEMPEEFTISWLDAPFVIAAILAVTILVAVAVYLRRRRE